MKKSILYSVLIALSLFVFPLQAFAYEGLCNCLNDVSINARVAYFHPSSKKVRRIYSNGWADYQLEFSAPLGKYLCSYGDLELWTGVSGFSRKGDSIGFHHRTRLRLIPLNLGLKYLICLAPSVQFYIGGALCYSFLKIRDHSEFVHEHTYKENFGGVAQLGIYSYVTDCIFTNFFIDYYYQRFHFSHASYSPYVVRHDLDMSGFKAGIGLGLKF